jgi:hypothetical protein
MKAIVATLTGALLVLATSIHAADTPRAVKALAALMQAMRSLEQFVGDGEWSSVHNEDASLGTAIGILREDASRTAATTPALTALLTAFGAQVGALHEAADAFAAADARARFRTLNATYTRILHTYGAQPLADARKLADVYACPMHRDVVGQRTDHCARCGMPLDQPVRVPLLYYGQSDGDTVRARIRSDQPIQPGHEITATLQLSRWDNGGPILITDLRIVHTERIHLLLVDPSLTDYHHVHPRPTSVEGTYAFSFTPARPGPYRAWADVRTTFGGFQEYAMAEIPAAVKAPASIDRTVALESNAGGLHYALVPDPPALVAGRPEHIRLHVSDSGGHPFTRLEPIMGTFAHVVAFNENFRTVLHIHPGGTKVLTASDRGGPDLSLQMYVTEPGFYRVFAEVQIAGVPRFAPFGIRVAPAPKTSGLDH